MQGIHKDVGKSLNVGFFVLFYFVCKYTLYMDLADTADYGWEDDG